MRPLEIKQFTTPAGEVKYITLTNDSGASVTLSTFGAGIVSIIVPDRDGHLDDVALGYADPADYISDDPCAGKTPGRFANRIARGKFSLKGREYSLAINNGPNALHGGPAGFANRNWEVRVVNDSEVEFTYRSADGEEGYPGNLTVKVFYTWNESNMLEINYLAKTDLPTVVNLTNHTYFNLNGHNSGSVLDHTLWLNASRYLPTDETLIPTGEILPTASTPMDFTEAKPLGRDINADFPALRFGKGYDSCYVIDDYEPGVISEAAVLASSSSGRRLDLFTTQPGIQVYTGNWLNGCPAPKTTADVASQTTVDGAFPKTYPDYSGVALEAQNFPDAPNHSNFPSALLIPGKRYSQTIIFAFSTFK